MDEGACVSFARLVDKGMALTAELSRMSTVSDRLSHLFAMFVRKVFIYVLLFSIGDFARNLLARSLNLLIPAVAASLLLSMKKM